MWNLKTKKNTNELISKTERELRHRKQIYGYQRGKGGGDRVKLGGWDWHVHTAILKMDNQQRPTV